MITMVIRNVYLRPTKSPRRPNNSAPKGRTANPAAKASSAKMYAAVGLTPEKNCFAMMRRERTVKVEVVPLENRTERRGEDDSPFLVFGIELHVPRCRPTRCTHLASSMKDRNCLVRPGRLLRAESPSKVDGNRRTCRAIRASRFLSSGRYAMPGSLRETRRKWQAIAPDVTRPECCAAPALGVNRSL